MVVDSSVVVALLLGEPDGNRFETALLSNNGSCMSAVNVYEAAIVMRRRNGMPAVEVIWRFLSLYAIAVLPFDEAQAKAAASAYERYGKGIDPKARLNLADCAAYALAKTLDVPLLFKGQDFAATDIRSCV